MPKNYTFEIRETFGKKYLKVFLKDGIDPENIANHLQQLASVHKSNVTKQKSGNIDLTIYPSKLYEIEETQDEVALTLENYFNGSPVDPQFVDQTVTGVSEKAFYQVIDYMNILGKNLEGFKSLNVRFDEERYRDYFIPFLNSISKNHSAKGEVFNRNGKTDILMFDNNGNNLFIAECKLWKGEKYLIDGLNQLLSNYVNWRDEKVALVIFNRDTKNFTDVIEKSRNAILAHELCEGLVNQRAQTNFTFSFKSPDDPNKKILVELVLFNFA